MEKLILFWCRRDFRTIDNPALSEAVQRANTLKCKFLPIYILDNNILKNPKNNIGHPRKLYLSKILGEYAFNFKEFFIFKNSTPVDIFNNLTQNFQIEVYANFDLEPYSLTRDKEIKEVVEKSGGIFKVFKDQLSIDFNTRTTTGNIYTVFTPFRNAVIDQFLAAKIYPKPDLSKLEFYNPEFKKLDFVNKSEYTNKTNLSDEIFNLIDSPWVLQFNLHPNNNLSTNLEQQISLDSLFERPTLEIWYTNEREALNEFDRFIDDKILKYKSDRDYLELDHFETGATSRMSPALKWGLVSARTLSQKISEKLGDPLADQSVFSYISELIWREFYKYLLLHFPSVLDLEFQKKYQNQIQWIDDRVGVDRFTAWIKAQTGYKLVDAAMTQVAKASWMHNRARMLVASILSKNLGVDWRWGQEYFRAVLVDLDEASNNGGWQWAASTGADPKPIRIFNPYTQQKNYDPQESYTKLWLPKDYNITEPIIEHSLARKEALTRYGLGQNTAFRDF